MDPTVLNDLISTHTTSPCNFGRVAGFTHCSYARGPDHEDFIAVQAIIKRGRVAEIRWTGTGCGLVMAAASMVSEAVKGWHWSEAGPIIETTLSPLRIYDRACLETVRQAFESCLECYCGPNDD